MNPKGFIRGATILVILTGMAGCQPADNPVGPTEVDPGPQLAEVVNPGSFTITSESGSLSLKLKDFELGSGVRLQGVTVTSDGALTAPMSGIVFPDQFVTLDLDLSGTFLLRMEISAIAPVTGIIGSTTVLNITLRLRFRPVGELPPGFGFALCRIEPINISLSTAGIFGEPYDPTTGRMTIGGRDFSVPRPQGCGSGFGGFFNYDAMLFDMLGGVSGSPTWITAVVTPPILLNTPPNLTPPAALSIGTNSSCTYVGSIGVATASDDEGSPSITNDAPAAFPLGTTTVLWTATDASANTSTSTQLVTVSDDDAPLITAPPDLTVSPNSGLNYVGSIGTATATDNCSPGAELIITSDAPASFPPGTTIVTWTATDAAGNVVTAVHSVTVAGSLVIDLIPGTTHPIRLRGLLRIIEVLVRGTPDVNATLIRPATATLGDGVGTDAGVKTYRGTPVAFLADVDRDGDKDLLLTFHEADLRAAGDLTPSTTTLILQAMLADGTRVQGVEEVTVVP